MTHELRGFFTEYARAFNALDGDAVARTFEVPSTMSTNTGFVVWKTFEEIAENMRGLCEAYRLKRFLEASWELETAIEQPPAHVFANVRWTVRRSAGLSASSFRTAYVLRRNGDDWRILVCIAYEESAC